MAPGKKGTKSNKNAFLKVSGWVLGRFISKSISQGHSADIMQLLRFYEHSQHIIMYIIHVFFDNKYGHLFP